MDMQGSRALAVTQQQAWDALNNPEVLKACIPGCDKVEATGEDQYAVGVAVKIGPVAAKFNGKITLSDINPPNSYTITFDGQGGAAGFGKGNSAVQLKPAAEGSGCELSYTVHASVGGKIAQLGQRLIDGVAKSMAEDFFKRFDEEMQRRHPEAYAAAAATTAAPPAPAPAGGKVPVWVWLAGAAVVLAAVWFLR
ncbi:MAG: carbon monoxide dehydrogenase subunit G [Ramlibacter sp.]|nr:carbon monoxide dehydrogenase subunit G [Ramlibacter sp.]MBX3657665.1 carbon monoxide dehydrogenase subunit G [Ramlibacter sp.]MCW5648968.1 carbon monoxide dehydrogenase subunit G [Ramlibacter sp.]